MKRQHLTKVRGALKKNLRNLGIICKTLDVSAGTIQKLGKE